MNVQPIIPGLGAAAQTSMFVQPKAKRKEPMSRRATSKQDYETPPEFYAAVKARFGPIAIDLAAHDGNHKEPRYLTRKDDSLSVDWLPLLSFGGAGWLNPEFSDLRPWAAKCQETGRRGGRVLMLAPASIDANWFHDHVLPSAVVFGISPRLTFVGAKDPYPKSLMLACYGFGPARLRWWRWRP